MINVKLTYLQSSRADESPADGMRLARSSSVALPEDSSREYQRSGHYDCERTGETGDSTSQVSRS